MIDIKKRFTAAFQPGDVFQPWWLAETGLAGIIFNISSESHPATEIMPSSVEWDVLGRHYQEFLKPDLVRDIADRGQQSPAIAMRHHACDVGPFVTPMISDPACEKIHLLEGHHRLIACLELGLPLAATVYDLYLFRPEEWPKSFSRLYNSTYTDAFWTLPQRPDTKGPWFTPHGFDDLWSCPKARPVHDCLYYVKSMALGLKWGADYGCAEGAHTWHAQQILGIPMTGVEAEPARVLRGLLRKLHHGAGPDYRVANLNTLTQPVPVDFAMCLSVFHHLKRPDTAFSVMAAGARAMIVEARADEPTRHRVESWFGREAFRFEQRGFLEPDRHFYVLWKE